MSQELAPVVALGIASAFFLYIAYKFNESEDYIIGLLAQIFQGVGLISVLVMLGVANIVASVAVKDVLGPWLGVCTVIVTLYALLYTVRAIINLTIEGFRQAKDLVKNKL